MYYYILLNNKNKDFVSINIIPNITIAVLFRLN